jgi:hypothetical protein
VRRKVHSLERTQAEILFLMAEPPRDDVLCAVSVHPAKAALATTSQLTFSPQPGLDQVLASISITGQPDWQADGDAHYTVQLGPCKSADPRFDGIGFPQEATRTAVRLVNEDAALPFVDALVPSSVSLSGRSITVHGTHFGPQSQLFFCGFVLGQTFALPAWTWVLNNATGLRQPIERSALAALRRAVGDDGFVTIDEPGYNVTLCDAMRDKGYEPSNCTAQEPDFRTGPKKPDLELSGLLQFQYVNSSVITFTTPCLSQVGTCASLSDLEPSASLFDLKSLADRN